MNYRIISNHDQIRKNGTETRNHEVHTDNSVLGFPNLCQFYDREDHWSDRSNMDSIKHRGIFLKVNFILCLESWWKQNILESTWLDL